MPRGTSSSRSGNRPLYAIDFTAVACGKRVANTKRRVRWRFGFANSDALASGETGTACRGEEHDVTLVWSVTSGKRLILADGQEVHYSNSRSAVIDFSWTMKGNHVLKVVAHATAPMSVDAGFRQYDFFVDGRSFFSFPKVYRLGLTGSKTMSPDGRGGTPREIHRHGGGRQAESSERRKAANGRSDSANIAAIEAPHNPDEEEAYLREAIKASIATEAKFKEEHPDEKPRMSAGAADLLIDFMDDFQSSGNTLSPVPTQSTGNEWALAPAPAQPNNQWATAPPPAQPDNNWAMASPQQTAPAAIQQQPAYDQYSGATAGGFAAAPPSNPFAPAAPAQPVQNFAAPPAPDAFGAPAFAPPATDAFAAPPPPPPVDAFASPPAPVAPVYGQPAAPVANDPFSAQPPATVASPTMNGSATNGSANVVLTMGTLTSDGLLAGGTTNPNITNSTTSNNATSSGTMADIALQNLMGSIDSFGITGAAAKPPAAANNPFDSNNIMTNTTLGEIKSAKDTERKGIMNAPPASGPGALVLASGGNQGGNWGGYGGMAGGQGMQQQPPQQQQYSMSGGYPQQQQPQMGYGQQPPMQQQQPQMGMQQQQGMMQGQQPPMQQQQGYGAQPPQYGQQPPMQQNQWGAPSY